MEKIQQFLDKYFGIRVLRKEQKIIVDNILSHKDVFCLLPTGGGKSLCYQLTALLMDGVTIVISPLISLMKDQVDYLKNIGISAEYINSTQTPDEIDDIMIKVKNGDIKLLYIAPERLDYNKFVIKFNNIHVSQVAIDEAHCVSQWGHDFRKSYRNILPFINSLENRPIVTAFTATATEEVRIDTIKLLGLNNPFIVFGGFYRNNLQINVHKEEDKLEFVKDYIRAHEDESGIIYCSLRKEVDMLYGVLSDIGYSVSKYHGGLNDEHKNINQEDFLFERKNVMIATNAFGMGIDKSNIRYIIHLSMPKNIEEYYQEIGRGGRDGAFCRCHLLYSRDDIRTAEFLINTSTKMDRREIELRKLQAMVELCETEGCYNEYILNYFGDAVKRKYCGNCSNCVNSEGLKDLTLEAQKILSCIYRTKAQFGISVMTDVLRGFKGTKIQQYRLDEISTYGIMREYTSKAIKDIINIMLEQGVVDRKEGTYSMLVLNKLSLKVLRGEEQVFGKLSDNTVCENEELFKKLRIYRKDISRRDKVKPYIVFSDAVLIEISNMKPKNFDELRSIGGVGDKKIERYGKDVLEIVKQFEEQEKN
ncbi:DNA helicase RecQ [Inconstantimicrobium mannanitabidum]|uniref:Uncharacterized protein n=1 Tax=Inconstantimicrobium mannanitabidum TaxID=1604901 RepID=A0ACB5RFC1_9CLOT|nr:DNA helicase RecQ [Clostridium sp. TW13]GKX67764.1 hypothetical protein rsdtw13_30220 [Clostridium sp. TW13]